jgi:hypothetical protein
MKYQKRQELICIRTKYSRKRTGVINFIKGKRYTIALEPFTIDPDPDDPGFNPINIVLVNEQGELQVIRGVKKTKYFKIPRPEGVPVTPPPAPKSRAQKLEERRQKKLEQEIQANEWKKVKKLKVKDKSKRIFKRAVSF